MLLIDKLKEFDTKLKEVKDLQAEVETLLGEDSIQTRLNQSFNALSQNLTSKITSTLKTQSENSYNEVVKRSETLLNELFTANLETTSQKVAQKLNTDAISKQVANKLYAENYKELEKILSEALEESDLTSHLNAKKEEINLQMEQFILYLQTHKDNLSKDFQSLTQDFLQSHKDEVFDGVDFSFLKEFIKNSENLKQIVALNAKSATREMIGYDKIEDFILEALKQKGQVVFEEVLGYQEMVEKRFLASLHLQAMGLQSELGNICKGLNMIADIAMAQKRLEALEKYPPQEPYHKSYQVM